MTRKEAAKILRSEICEPYTGEYSSELTCVATRMGIDALEEESVLDKIRKRVELEKLGCIVHAGYYNALVKVLQIIDDEYKVESKDKE